MEQDKRTGAATIAGVDEERRQAIFQREKTASRLDFVLLIYHWYVEVAPQRHNFAQQGWDQDHNKCKPEAESGRNQWTDVDLNGTSQHTTQQVRKLFDVATCVTVSLVL